MQEAYIVLKNQLEKIEQAHERVGHPAELNKDLKVVDNQ